MHDSLDHLDPESFSMFMCLFGFNIQSWSNEYREVLKDKPTSIDIRFKNPVGADGLTLVIMTETQQNIYVPHNRAIRIDPPID